MRIFSVLGFPFDYFLVGRITTTLNTHIHTEKRMRKKQENEIERQSSKFSALSLVPLSDVTAIGDRGRECRGCCLAVSRPAIAIANAVCGEGSMRVLFVTVPRGVAHVMFSKNPWQWQGHSEYSRKPRILFFHNPGI